MRRGYGPTLLVELLKSKAMANLKHTESTREKIARIERKRRAIEQDKREFGFYPDLDDDEIRAIMSAKVERTLKRLAIEQINLHL